MTRSYHPFSKCLTILLASALLTSCKHIPSVGPNFKKPDAPSVKDYTPNPVSTTAGTSNVLGGDPQRFRSSQDIAGDWWTLFHSKPLNELIERSLKNNPNLKAAQAALAVARENAKAQVGAYYPQVGASFSGSRQRTSTELSPVPSYTTFNFDLYTPQLTVSYVPDVFGLNRRTVESLNAQVEQARFVWVATDIALTANVVSSAIQEASLREQIAATHELIDLNSNMLRILKTEFTNGYADRLDVAAQEAQLAQILTTLPPLLLQLAQQHDLLAALSGGFPSEGPSEMFELAGLQLPQDLPLSLPSKLVAQRPDVRQAEENMHSASALVGVAVANRLPNFMLTADLGSSALSWGKVFGSGTGFWGIGGTVAQPLFQGFTLLHRQRAAWATYTNAAELYRGAVLTAFQNVADSLSALDQDAKELKAAAFARDTAKVTLDLSKQQYETGYANYLSLLSAETAYDSAVVALVQAQANRYSDTAALFLALGGGWWNRADLTKK